ncbi:vitamin K epoxide reductase complex subunit 1 [Prorops nasuta]|uniref:vitamin K epoxide reductase complex subunit 1 n=1 Tax=Prorops nasuta TaxID=863751 RepID=UPI0034CD9E9C
MSARDSTRRITAELFFACIAGFFISYYAYTVENAKEKDENYEALCDINEAISCTKAFQSEYGKGFGLIPPSSPLYYQNPIYGLIFYTLLSMICLFDNFTSSITVISMGVASNIASIYLAYILYLLKTICLVCVTTYIVNILITVLAIKKHKSLFSKDLHKKKIK